MTHVEGWLLFLVVSTNSAKFLVHVLRDMINNEIAVFYIVTNLTLPNMQGMSRTAYFLVRTVVELEE